MALRFLPIAAWLTEFQQYVRGLGATGYVLYTVVYAICVALLVPASVLSLGAGAIFGVVKGSIVVTIGATSGATLAFILARTIFRRRAEAMAASNAKLREIDAAIQREGTKLMLLMRVSGFPPFTWINWVLGITGVRLVPYVVTTFIGIIPGVIAFTYAGAAGAAVATGGPRRWTLIITAVGAIAVSVYVARIASRAVRKASATGPPP